MVYCLSYLQPQSDFLHAGFSFLECSRWIWRADKIDSNILINAYHRILHQLMLKINVEIFPLHKLFAQCSHISSSTSEKWELRIWNLGHMFETSNWWTVSNTVDNYFDSNFWDADCLKIFKKRSYRSFFSQCRSFYGFQTLHFICNQYGCKLLLQLIQNQSRDCFSAFACWHLKLQCFSIGIWAHSLFLDR